MKDRQGHPYFISTGSCVFGTGVLWNLRELAGLFIAAALELGALLGVFAHWTVLGNADGRYRVAQFSRSQRWAPFAPNAHA
jgi:hypothetical protein